MGSSRRIARGRCGLLGDVVWGVMAAAAAASVAATPAIAAGRDTGVRVAVAATAVPSAVASATEAPSTQDLDKLMGLLAQRQHGHVTFVEEHFLAVLDRPVESSGELLYDAPDHLEKRTLKPKPETVVLEHGVITAHRGRHTYVLNLSDYPQIVPLIDSIRATLAGDRASLERIFKVTLDGALDHWKLVLLPSDTAVAKSVKQIRIEGAQDAIHSVEIQQADGDRSLLTIGPEVAQ
jgi:Outer membrane lipoprotein carrier protein LolA-like